MGLYNGWSIRHGTQTVPPASPYRRQKKISRMALWHIQSAQVLLSSFVWSLLDLVAGTNFCTALSVLTVLETKLNLLRGTRSQKNKTRGVANLHYNARTAMCSAAVHTVGATWRFATVQGEFTTPLGRKVGTAGIKLATAMAASELSYFQSHLKETPRPHLECHTGLSVLDSPRAVYTRITVQLTT
jgi:hypothetical protein